MNAIENFITFCDTMTIGIESLETRLTSSTDIKNIIQNVTDYVNLLFSTKYKSFQSKLVYSHGITNSKTEVPNIGFFYSFASCSISFFNQNQQLNKSVCDKLFNDISLKFKNEINTNKISIAINESKNLATGDYGFGVIKKGVPMYTLIILDNTVDKDLFKAHHEDYAKRARINSKLVMRSYSLKEKYFEYELSDYAKKYNYDTYYVIRPHKKFKFPCDNFELFTDDKICFENEEMYLSTAYAILNKSESEFIKNKNEIIRSMQDYISEWMSYMDDDFNISIEECSNILNSKIETVIASVHNQNSSRSYNEVMLVFPPDVLDDDHNLSIIFYFDKNNKYLDWNISIDG